MRIYTTSPAFENSPASGIGKTTSILPTLSKGLGLPIVSTGALFKSLAGNLAHPNGQLGGTAVLEGRAALVGYIEEGRYDAGLRFYEELKSAGKLPSHAMVELIEAGWRSIAPDASVKSAVEIARIQGYHGFVTDIVNRAEYQMAQRYGEVIVLGLHCENPVTEGRHGENRSILCPPEEMAARATYRLENSVEAAIDLISQLPNR